MSAEPGAPAEEGDEPANKRYAGNVARLAVANLKQQLEQQMEAVSKANGEHVQRAIEHLKWELKQERDSECLEREREASRKKNRSRPGVDHPNCFLHSRGDVNPGIHGGYFAVYRQY
jgi:predicted site-specific integrase-resolvase